MADPVLPTGFMTIEQVKELPNEKLGKVFINIIGLITDFQPPVQTRGPDFKCTMEIKDNSIKYEKYGLKVHILWPETKMPQISGLFDAVVIRTVKVGSVSCQLWSGQVSLLANHHTEFHILAASHIPQSLADPPSHEQDWNSYPAVAKKPGSLELSYVVQTRKDLDEGEELPTADDFRIKACRALKVKDKFSLLKDVKPDCFYTIIGEVIRVFDGGIGVTVYITDYTTNPSFYDYSWKDDASTGGRDGDEYGYLQKKAKNNDTNTWPGPYGKQTIQLTLFDAHGLFVREHVKIHEWLRLKNVRIKHAKIGGCLEGVLYGEGEKVNVETMQMSEDPRENDERWKATVARKRDYWKKFNEQKAKYLKDTEELDSTKKRRAIEEPVEEKSNSKKRRKKRREAGQLIAAGAALQKPVEAAPQVRPDLNEHGDIVKCSYLDKAALRIAQITKPQEYILPNSDQVIVLPFVNNKYRANVRVVGYFPHKIVDFAVGRRVTEYDMLSDHSEGEGTNREEDMRIFKAGKGFGVKKWEWRFALEVEDSDSQLPKERMWLVVDNLSGQGLLDIDAEKYVYFKAFFDPQIDSASLRTNPSLLAELKERLCILWGDLEEQKSALMQKQQVVPSSFSEEPASSPMIRPGAQPNINSDDEDNIPALKSLEERSLNAGWTVNKIDVYHPPVKNKPFACCIKQYGVKVDEPDPSKATAGNGNDGKGKRWERRFGLFGVNIV
ncbi:hypothetical protein B0O99DRAFT_503754 [Bisporella sp. PMI_857]|nr:hypothetical protein B0O99DRAFT_503754 [Bisporella sp. PMI_857]